MVHRQGHRLEPEPELLPQRRRQSRRGVVGWSRCRVRGPAQFDVVVPVKSRAIDDGAAGDDLRRNLIERHAATAYQAVGVLEGARRRLCRGRRTLRGIAAIE